MSDPSPSPTAQLELTPTPSEPPAGGTPAPWYEGLQDPTLKTSERLQRLGSVEDVARSLIHAESRLGVPVDQLLRLPADPKDEKAMREVYSKLGMPDKIEGYGIKLPDGASDFDKGRVTAFLEHAHKLGANQSQVQGFMKWYEELGAQDKAAAERTKAEIAAKGTAELQKEWGARFDTYKAEISRFVRDKGGPELAEELEKDLGQYPQLAKVLAAAVDERAEPGGAPRGETAGLDVEMTPAQAQAALNKFNGDEVMQKALHDPTHVSHKHAVAERSRLLALANPQKT